MEAAPRSQEMERAYEGTARGSIESLGRWNEKSDDPAMPSKMGSIDFRRAFVKFVDELVQNGASSGILAIKGYTISWSASPDDTSYQRHGPVEDSLKAALAKEEWWASLDLKTLTTQLSTAMQNEHYDDAEKFMAELNKWKEFRTGRAQHDKEVRRLKAARAAKNGTRFADFEGVVDDWGEINQNMAVYRVTLPRGGLDPWKWAGRPPPPAPEDAYTGPRRDGLLSTGEISGEYSAPCCVDGPVICNSMTVVPLGADAIETWRTGCCFLPCFGCIGPVAEGGVRTRNHGTNDFGGMTFSAWGTFKLKGEDAVYKKCSQKRTFQKVETRDLAGKWCGCVCSPFVPFWPLSCILCTRKKALNGDQYEEPPGLRCCLALPLPCPVDPGGSTTRTRVYVNGHATNGFAKAPDKTPGDVHWHRDPGCAAFIRRSEGRHESFFAKKLC